MKQSLLSILFLLLPMLASADPVEIDGIYYNLVSKVKEAEVTSTKPNGYYSGEVVIPESVEYGGVTYSVTSIGESAFSGCFRLHSVTIPNSVTSIGESAFSNSQGLTSVTIGNSVTSIGNRAFTGCTGLTSVTIPNSVTSIGQIAFSGCSSLTSVTIPNSVTSIGESAFSTCSGLTSVTIGNSVTTIGDCAFIGCTGLTSVTIPNSLTSIGEYVFKDCSGLTSLIIPESVTSIGFEAFANCSGLTSVTIPNSVTSIGGEAFQGCSSLISVTIPNSVTSIDDYTFVSCSSLTSVTIPNSVTSIGRSVFYGCSELTDVYCYAENVPNTNADPFKNSNIEYATLHVPAASINDYKSADPWKNFKEIVAIGGSQEISDQEINGIYYNFVSKVKEAEVTSNPNKYSGEVVIPESVEYKGVTYRVTSIGEYAFSGCFRLTSVTIANSVTSIGVNAFCDCSGLTSVTIPNSLTSIGNYAFWNCSSLTSVTIPSSVTFIGDGAFHNCSSLTSVTIPNSVTSISSYAFQDCSGLTSVTIPNSVTSIGYSAFINCSGLTSVAIPNSVTEIGGKVFSGCSGLTSVTIPNSVTSIGSSAFSGCSGLTSVSIGSSIKTIRDNVFSGCSELSDLYCYAEKVPTTYADVFKDSYIEYATLHVPAASINDYKTTEPWKNFKEIVAIGDVQTNQCATPTISYENGEITFSCETEGVEYVSEIKAADAKNYYDGKITLTNIYTVSVYATKDGYVNSDVATMEIHPTNTGEGGSGSGETGDVNGDKKVDVSDIVKIVNIIMNGSGTSSDDPSTKPSDETVTSMISASFGGGAYSSINGVIQSGSQLMWRFSNNSTENVTLTGLQLINGATGAEGNNMLTENVEVVAGETKGYTITVGALGIQQPKVRFTYQYNNKTYTVEAVMPD